MNNYALISVFDKTNILAIVSALIEQGYKIIATPGTGKLLVENNHVFLPIVEATHNPEGFEDCIQALSYSTAVSILFDRKNPTHRQNFIKLNLKQIDVVICNFPPFKEVVKKADDFNIHHVDVGGPFMIRSAATNFKNVLVVTDQNDYLMVVEALKKNAVDKEFRKKMAIKAFHYISKYDSEIIKFLKSKLC